MSGERVLLDARDHAELVDEARPSRRARLPRADRQRRPRSGGHPDRAVRMDDRRWPSSASGASPTSSTSRSSRSSASQLDGPTAARADVRMRLASAAAEPLEIRAGTEVGTLRTAAHESIVFTLQEDFLILPLRPAAYVVQRGGASKEIGVADGVAYPAGPDQLPFGRPPQSGDALYLGFESSLARLLMRVEIEASMARGAGVRPDDPPLRWEVSQGEGGWTDVEVLEDLTGGFNYGSGTVDVQCPPGSGIEPIAGRRLHWLRCRIADTTRVSGEPAVYTQPPEIYQITASSLGALLAARALGARERRGARRQRRHTRADVRDALRAGARAGAGRDARGAGRHRGLGGLGAARLVRRLARRRSSLRDRPRARRRSSSARSSATPTAATTSAERSRPRAPRCGCRATATAAAAPATSRQGR